MKKKLQVFISSTFTDLQTERQAAVEAILSAGHIPAGMELFSAGNESQLRVIERWIDESDVFLLILGGRYGTLEPKSGKSYIQLEYEYAISKDKPFFAVVLKEEALDKKVEKLGKDVLELENPKLYKEFMEIVLSKMSKFVEDEKDIRIAIYETLSDFEYRYDLTGWISGKEAGNAEKYMDENGRLMDENSRLAEENKRLKSKNGQLEKQISDAQEQITRLTTIKKSIRAKKEQLTKRIERILHLINAKENDDDEITWTNNDSYYEVAEPQVSFSAYYVYSSNKDNIDYVLLLSVDSKDNYDFATELANIRLMIEDYKDNEGKMQFKFVICSIEITQEQIERCEKFFERAVKTAKVKNKKLLTFEIWDEDKLFEYEEKLGLKVVI